MFSPAASVLLLNTIIQNASRNAGTQYHAKEDSNKATVNKKIVRNQPYTCSIPAASMYCNVGYFEKNPYIL